MSVTCKKEMAAPFVALDFETADHGRDSACALAMVRVEGGRITDRRYRLIRPPRSTFFFTWVHGITWEDVLEEPPFARIWEETASILEGASYIAAHNASFDRGVLHACCLEAGLQPPTLPFLCTVRLARRAFGLRRANLPAVCRHLGLPLKHHDAASDAEACAQIVIEARTSSEREASAALEEACFLRAPPGRRSA